MQVSTLTHPIGAQWNQSATTLGLQSPLSHENDENKTLIANVYLLFSSVWVTYYNKGGFILLFDLTNF
jgi:hypothetical protein